MKSPVLSKPGRKANLDVGLPAIPEPKQIDTVRASGLLIFLPPLLSGGLMWLCYYPVAWGWLGWVALAPCLWLVRSGARARWIYLASWVGGLVFYWPALQWLRVADDRMYATWAGLATYCSLYFPLAIFLLRRLDAKANIPLVITFPVVWTALEFLRAHLMGGFAWYFLGHTQHQFLAVIQVADLAGAYAVTFLVAAVNALVFEVSSTWLNRFLLPPERQPSPRWRGMLALQAAGVLILIGTALTYGMIRLGENDFRDGPLVALIQGNLDQRLRNAVAGDDWVKAAETVYGHYDRLSKQAAGHEPRPDLIVWPETSFPYEWQELSQDYPEDRIPYPELLAAKKTIQKRVGVSHEDWQLPMLHTLNEPVFREAATLRTNVLIGLNGTVYDGDERRYNTAVLLGPASGQFSGRYDKMHRVPFGEYVPFLDWLPWMAKFAPYDFPYSIRPGEHFTRFQVGDYHFGVVICFEDTDPTLARQYVRTDSGQPAADFLVNISNDGWFDGTSEHEEHLAICRFRAVECRRAVARAVNMGISAVIDGDGRLRALPADTLQESKSVSAVVTASIPIDRRRSLYASWGDWLPWTCWGVVGLGLVAPWVRGCARRT